MPRLVSTASACAGVLAGVLLGAAGHAAWADAPASRRSRFAKLDVFARALAIVEQHYVRPVDDRALVDAALRGLVQDLDPHSSYLDAQEARLLREEIEGAFGGVGMVVQLARDEQGRIYLDVRDVVPGGPAAAAGVAPGDRVVRIAGKPVAHFPDLREAIVTIRGEPGTAVAMTLEHEGERRDLSLVRARIDPPSVEVEYLGDGVGWLRLTTFSDDAGAEVRAGIARLRKQARADGGPRGLVLDLRDNGGGLLLEAIDVVDAFVARGVIVRTRGRGGVVLDEARARPARTERDLPLVVLVNGASASASEIVAGALQDHRRALVVGERTYGKGSVQSPFELGDGSLLKLTTALYYTPNDRLIQASGIVPDVYVGGLPPGTSEQDTRADLPPEREHFRHLRPEDFGKATATESDEPAAVRAAGDDHQLKVAVQHVLAWDKVAPRRRRRRG